MRKPGDLAGGRIATVVAKPVPTSDPNRR